MNAYQIMEEILNVVESSKEELVNKYVPNMKAERRHLDKESKKGNWYAKALNQSADVSADIAKIAKKDVDKADDNYFNVRTNPNTTSDERNKAYKELKAAHAELIDWKRDEQKTRKKAEETKVKAEEANKKRNELNKKIASLKGRSDVATDKAFEALELMEEIINEVSLGKWKEAAKSSLPKRKENAEIADKATEKGWDEYDKNARRYPEEEPALYRLAQANDEASIKAKERAEHAEDVANIGSNDKASANKVIKAAKKVQDKREDAFGRNPSARTLKRSIEANKAAEADPVKSRTDEAFSLMEEILSYATNLFELDDENKQNISPNKIRRIKKDKEGEDVEVVSVADELFPYEGNAKEQFNQKVLAKINDMIEGTGSLEDLIQFVRKGVQAKNAYEAIEEGKEPNKECEYRKAKWDEATQKYFDTKKKHLDWEGQHPETKKAYDEERKAYADLDKARRDSKKVYGPYEAFEKAIDLIETFIKEARDPITRSAVGMVLRGKEAEYNKHVDDESKYADRADRATGYRSQVNREKAEDAGRKAEAAHKDLRKTKGEYLDILRKDKGLTNPQAHAVLNKAIGEAFDLMEEIINEVSVKRWKEAATKVLPKRIEDKNRAYDKEEKLEKIDRKERNEKYVTPDGKTDDEKYRNSSTFKNYMNSLHDSIKAGNRVAHASAVSKLPDSKVSAQKVRRAADKSLDTRERQWSDIEASGSSGKEWTKKVTRAGDRMEKAEDIAGRGYNR